jgi:hypothetical protein
MDISRAAMVVDAVTGATVMAMAVTMVATTATRPPDGPVATGVEVIFLRLDTIITVGDNS